MEVFLTPKAQKQYKALQKSNKSKVTRKLQILKSNPIAGKKLSGEFEGLRSLKVWPYRIIHFIDQERGEVWVTSILHRQGAYK